MDEAAIVDLSAPARCKAHLGVDVYASLGAVWRRRVEVRVVAERPMGDHDESVLMDAGVFCSARCAAAYLAAHEELNG